MERKDKTITIKEASQMLGKQYNTVLAAAERGVFTKLPVTGHEQRLAREQVELFLEKTGQLKLSVLSKEERKRWEEIEAQIKGELPNAEIVAQASQSLPLRQSEAPATVPLFNLDRSALEYLAERNYSIKTRTPVGETSFQSALADKEISERALVTGIGGVLLLGLIVFFVGKAIKNQTASDIGEKFMHAAFITANDLLEPETQRKVAKAVQEYPEEAIQTYNVLKEAGAIAA